MKTGVLRIFSRKGVRHPAGSSSSGGGGSALLSPRVPLAAGVFAAGSVAIDPAVLGWIGMFGVTKTKMPAGRGDNLVTVKRLGGVSTPGAHHCCPGQDLQLPALPFPFFCPPFSSLLSLWHQPWLSSLHPSHSIRGLLWPRTCSLLYSHISGRLRAAKTLDLWPFSSRVPDFWQWAVLAGRGRDPTRRCSITFFCSVEHHSFLWAGDQAGGSGAEPFPTALARSTAPRRQAGGVLGLG